MHLSVHKSIFEAYPRAEIGYVVASFDQGMLEETLIGDKVSLLQQSMLARGFAPGTSVRLDPRIKIWCDIYATFGVKPSEFPSSIEALSRRALNNKFPRIMPIIDLYNAFSVETLLPMGGYDLAKLVGDISLGFAAEGDLFKGLGCADYQHIDPRHVVYKDSQQVICWLWNHRDAVETAIDRSTRRAIFFIDSADSGLEGILPMLEVVEAFQRELTAVGADAPIAGFLSQALPAVDLDLALLEEVTSQAMHES